MVLALSTSGGSLLCAQTMPLSAPTETVSEPQSLTILPILLQADALLTTLDSKVQSLVRLSARQSADLATLNVSLLDSQVHSAMLDTQLTNSSLAQVKSKAALVKSQTSLDALTISFDKQSSDLQEVRAAADKLKADSETALAAERAKLLPWQLATVGSGATALAILVYLAGHALTVW